MEYRTVIHSVFTALGTVGVYLFGGFDMILQVLVAFLVFDIVTGVLYGIAQGELSSEIYLNGAFKKVGILVLVTMAHLIDQIVQMDDPLIRTVVIMTLIGYEGISILENLANLNVPVPSKLQDILKTLKEEEAI